MKKHIVMGLLVLCVLWSAGTAFAGVSVGAKLWYADTDGADDPASLIGPTLSLDLGETSWLSITYLKGRYKFGNGLVKIDKTDADAILGITASVFDLGVGVRYSIWEFGVEGLAEKEELVMWGPMAYVGLGDVFGGGPLGWYLAGSYMFKDFGDWDDEPWDAAEHWNVEGGLFFSHERVSVSAGYRRKEFIHYNDEFTGLTASVSLRF